MKLKDTPLPPSGGSWIHDPVTGTLQRAVEPVTDQAEVAEPVQTVIGDAPVAPSKEQSK